MKKFKVGKVQTSGVKFQLLILHLFLECKKFYKHKKYNSIAREKEILHDLTIIFAIKLSCTSIKIHIFYSGEKYARTCILFYQLAETNIWHTYCIKQMEKSAKL